MLLTPIRGFVNTPISRLICVGITVTSILVLVLQFKYLFRLSIDPDILEYGQYWRLAIYPLVFLNESDYLLGVLLWFNFKVLERFFGSKKYASLLVVFSLYNLVLTFLLMNVLQVATNFAWYVLKKQETFQFFTTPFNSVTSGPIGVVSSMYVCFGKYVPVAYTFQVNLGPKIQLELTDRFQVNILYTLLLINNGVESILPGLAGLFVGKLYVNDILLLKSWLMPSLLFKLIVHPDRAISSWQHRRYQEVPNEEEEEEASAEDGIRAETPVRPLASQFLDTFRNTAT